MRNAALETFWQFAPNFSGGKDVGPRPAAHNRVNVAAANGEFITYSGVGISVGHKLENLMNSLLRENGAVVFFKFVAATLLLHVGRIVGGIAQEQVFWIAARRVVARMKDIHPIWDGATFSNPCDYVRIGDFAAHTALAVSANAAAKPWPAVVRSSRDIYASDKIKGIAKPLFRTRNMRYFLVSHGKGPSCSVRGAVPFAAGGTSHFYHIPAGGFK